MANESGKTQIDLGARKLKLSEFLLGIFVGIIVSVIIDTYFEVVTLNSDRARWTISISFGILVLLYVWYKRMVGYPDYVEYTCKFNKDKKWDWKDFNVLFRTLTRENLKKNRYWGLNIWYYRGAGIWERITGYSRAHIGRRVFGLPRAFIYQYKKLEQIRFLIAVPDFISSHDGIIKSINESLQQLQTKGVIKNLSFSPMAYYYGSFINPFKKKGKLIE